jgi:hypothetical protein
MLAKLRFIREQVQVDGPPRAKALLESIIADIEAFKEAEREASQAVKH